MLKLEDLKQEFYCWDENEEEVHSYIEELSEPVLLRKVELGKFVSITIDSHGRHIRKNGKFINSVIGEFTTDKESYYIQLFDRRLNSLYKLIYLLVKEYAFQQGDSLVYKSYRTANVYVKCSDVIEHKRLSMGCYLQDNLGFKEETISKFEVVEISGEKFYKVLTRSEQFIENQSKFWWSDSRKLNFSYHNLRFLYKDTGEKVW